MKARHTFAILCLGVGCSSTTAFVPAALPASSSHATNVVRAVPLELDGQLDTSKSWEVELNLDGNVKKLTVPEGTSVLEAAEMAFDDPPFSCRNGVCTTCAGKILAGEENKDYKLAVHGLGVPQREKGYTLTCQTYPIGPGLKVALNQYDEVYYDQYGQYETGEAVDAKKNKLFGLF